MIEALSGSCGFTVAATLTAAQLAAAEKEMDEHLAKLVGMQSVKDNMTSSACDHPFAFLFTIGFPQSSL